MLLIEGHRSHLRDFAFSPDGLRLASAAGRGARVSLWDAGTGKRICYLKANNYAPITSLLWLPHDGSLVASAQYGNLLRWTDENERAQGFPKRPGTWTSRPEKLLTSPDGHWFVIASRYYGGYRITRWSPIDLRARSEGIAGQGMALRAIALSPEGDRIAMCGMEHYFQVQLFGRTNRFVTLKQQGVRGLAFSPDGSQLAVAAQRSVHLWQVHGLELANVTTLSGHRRVVNDVVFTPDGSCLLSGSDDGTVKVWDVNGQCERTTFSWDIGEIKAVRVAQDGMRAGAGGYRRIMVWDLEE